MSAIGRRFEHGIDSQEGLLKLDALFLEPYLSPSELE